jgi:prophage antirepressor-like protein
MTNDIVPFEYEGSEFRTTLVAGEPWFAAADLARALGYKDATHILRGLDDDEKGLQIVETPGGDQQLQMISEPGLYHLFNTLRRPEVKPFQRWVNHEVLPALRKNGRYEVLREIQLDTATVAELEKMADGYVAQGERVGISLVPLLVELYVRRAWETYSLTIGAYFRDYRGIGPDRFTLPKGARREFVALMATAAPEAPNAHLALISGNSLRTVQQDRSELGVANPGRVEGQRAVTSRKEPAGKDPRESVGDIPEDDEFETWQKLLKTLSREELLALRDMIDNLLDEE